MQQLTCTGQVNADHPSLTKNTICLKSFRKWHSFISKFILFVPSNFPLLLHSSTGDSVIQESQ